MALWLLNKCCIGPSRPGEDPRYGHPCACPEGFLACVSAQGVATLCGFSEFSGYASVPPKKYKTKTLSGSESRTFGSFQTGCDPLNVDVDIAATGYGSIHYNCEDNSISDGFLANYSANWSCTTSTSPNGSSRSASGCAVSSSRWPKATNIGVEGDCPSATFGTRSGTADGTSNVTGVLTVPSGSFTHTLSDEDTEADAIDRAEDSTEGSSCTAIREERVNGFAFNYTTVKYEAILTGLIPGFYYDGVVPTEKRAEVVGETYEESDWSSDTPIEIPKFRASKVFQLIGGGTLNVPDQDFIDENYSLDPLDYPGTFPVDGSGDLVDPDAKVITPVTELIADSGEARRLLNPKITKWWSETERDRP